MLRARDLGLPGSPAPTRSLGPPALLLPAPVDLRLTKFLTCPAAFRRRYAPQRRTICTPNQIAATTYATVLVRGDKSGMMPIPTTAITPNAISIARCFHNRDIMTTVSDLAKPPARA